MLKFLLVVAVFAAVVYMLMWGLERRRAGGTPARPIRRKPQSPPTRSIAPDDDDEFLRGLDRRKPKDSDPTES